MSDAVWDLFRDLGQSAVILAVLAWLTREILKHWLSKDVAIFKEELSHQNHLAIEQGKWRNELRLAALDERLKAHQEAYDLWDRIRLNLIDEHDERWKGDDEKLWGVVKKCEEWWPKNCLYLSAGARSAFRACIRAAADRWNLLDWYESARHDAATKEKARAALRENRETIDRTGEALVRGADLPSLGEDEFMNRSSDTRLGDGRSEA